MKYVSLFAGIGGFDLALNRLGHECVYANEWDKNAAEIYSKNFGNKENRELIQGTEWGSVQYKGDKPNSKVGRDSQPETWGDREFQQSKDIDTRDIRAVPTSEIPDHDLLVGGFPCQAFSIAGKRRGFDDTRGTLFFEIARIAKEHKPMFLLLENVKGLVSHDGGRTLETILDSLQSLGYYTNYEIHNSKNYGVPQNRERIFFKCTHIKGLLCIGQESGQKKRITFSERVIQEFLFQTLLNYLPEVKKLQEHALKDSVVGYLLLKEINQNLKSSDESILGGTGIPMEGSMFQSKEGEVWQNIDIWLSKNLGENSQEVNKSTILTAIKQITESETFTYLQMLKAILYAIVLLRKSSNRLWNEVLSSLTLIQENTKYERINTKAEKGVITESGTLHLTNNLQDFSRYFIVGHIRGQPRPEVFPITEGSRGVDEGNGTTSQTCITPTIDSRVGATTHRSPYIKVRHEVGKVTVRKYIVDIKGLQEELKKRKITISKIATELNVPKTKVEHWFRTDGSFAIPESDSWFKLKELVGITTDRFDKSIMEFEIRDNKYDMSNRVYEKDGISPTLTTPQEIKVAGTLGTSCGTRTGKTAQLLHIPTNTKLGYDIAEEKNDGIRLEFPNSKTARGRVIKGASQSLKTSGNIGVIDKMRIRRLTPKECERLQGFPDNWTAKGINEKGEEVVISDTQRYKCLGNAVTVNVVYEVARRLNGNTKKQN